MCNGVGGAGAGAAAGAGAGAGAAAARRVSLANSPVNPLAAGQASLGGAANTPQASLQAIFGELQQLVAAMGNGGQLNVVG